MIIRILQFILILLVLFLAGAGVSFSLWGITGLLIFIGVVSVGLIILAVSLKSIASKLITKLFIAPFAAKGAVLKDAQVTIHSITPAEPPADWDSEPDEEDDYTAEADEDAEEEEDEEVEPGARSEPEPRRWVYLDATITPGEAQGPFQLWEPSELGLAGPNAASAQGIEDMDGDEDEDVGEIADYRLWRDGDWSVDDEGKVPGEQRVRLHVGLNPSVTAFRFRYYLEVFGHVVVPPAPQEADLVKPGEPW